MEDEIKKKPEEKLEEKKGDIESGKITAAGGGGELYPNMAEDVKLRWAFLRKVYFILAVQCSFTATIAATFNRVRPIPRFIKEGSHASRWFFIVILILPIVALIPMLYYRRRHPVNLVFLGLFTLCISLLVGWISALLNGVFLLETAFITTAVLFSLTIYTFWAAKRGHDFRFLAPFLAVSSLVLLCYVFIQLCLPPSRISLSIYGCVATIVFSGFIIFDTDRLIKRHKFDEYTHAAVSIYLDVVNLFMAILGIPAFGI